MSWTVDQSTVGTLSLPSAAADAERPPPGRQTLPARRVPRWWAEGWFVLAWLSLLVVVALWLHNGGISRATSPRAIVSSAGVLTGLVSADLMLIQVILMARIPMLERAYGQDRLATVHRGMGFTSFWLMVAHILLILLAGAGLSITDLPAATVGAVLHAPGMVLATIGTAFLCLVVVSSIRAARRRLRYESWHLLHLYAYAGTFLALPHQIWAGKNFTATPFAATYWWALWGAAALAVLIFRLGVPVVLNRRHQLYVSDVHTVALPHGGVTHVSVKGQQLHRLKVAGGQFFLWRFLDGPGWTRAHPFSLSAAPDGHTLEISVAHVGDGTYRLADLQPGTRVLVEGPYGRLHDGVRTRRKVLLLAAGVGIAPMKALLESLEPRPGEAILIYRVSDLETAPLLEALETVTRTVDARAIVLDGHRITERASWLPRHWSHVDDVEALTYLVPDIAERDIFICGGPGWMDALEAALRGAGVPPGNIHTERFSY